MIDKFQVGDLVKIKDDTVDEWDNMMELYDVDPESLGVVIEARTNDFGDHSYNILFQNTTRALRFDHNELETA